MEKCYKMQKMLIGIDRAKIFLVLGQDQFNKISD